MEYIYAALLLHRLGKEVNEDNLSKVISACDVSVDESKVKVLVSALSGVDIDEKLANASLAVATTSASEPQPEAKKEEPKKAEPKAAAAEGLASLFG